MSAYRVATVALGDGRQVRHVRGWGQRVDHDRAILRRKTTRTGAESLGRAAVYPAHMPSVALALEDFVPVILSAVGLAMVTRMIRRFDRNAGHWAAVGTLLVVVGGLSRASWKLIMAGGGPDLVPLFLALYVFLATGYLLVVMATWRGFLAANGGRGRVPAWLPALVALALLVPLTAILASAGGRILPLLWLFVATAGAIVTSLLLARWARRAGRPGIAWLFIVSLAVTIVLNGLARAESQPEALQWVEQLLNTATQGAFLVAAIGLERATRRASTGALRAANSPIGKQPISESLASTLD